ncbi:MAG: hypothetical protein ACF8Q5_00865 [Phycisphaerales bacterium JB040]
MDQTTCQTCTRVIPTEEPASLFEGAVLCRECRDAAEPVCPHCHNPTGRRLPKHKGGCRACGEQFLVDRDQQMFGSVLLTGDQHRRVGEVGAFVAWLGEAAPDAESLRLCALASRRTRESAEVAKARILRATRIPSVPPHTPLELEDLDRLRELLERESPIGEIARDEHGEARSA